MCNLCASQTTIAATALGYRWKNIKIYSPNLVTSCSTDRRSRHLLIIASVLSCLGFGIMFNVKDVNKAFLLSILQPTNSMMNR